MTTTMHQDRPDSRTRPSNSCHLFERLLRKHMNEGMCHDGMERTGRGRAVAWIERERGEYYSEMSHKIENDPWLVKVSEMHKLREELDKVDPMIDATLYELGLLGQVYSTAETEASSEVSWLHSEALDHRRRVNRLRIALTRALLEAASDNGYDD